MIKILSYICFAILDTDTDRLIKHIKIQTECTVKECFIRIYEPKKITKKTCRIFIHCLNHENIKNSIIKRCDMHDIIFIILDHDIETPLGLFNTVLRTFAAIQYTELLYDLDEFRIISLKESGKFIFFYLMFIAYFSPSMENAVAFNKLFTKMTGRQKSSSIDIENFYHYYPEQVAILNILSDDYKSGIFEFFEMIKEYKSLNYCEDLEYVLYEKISEIMDILAFYSTEIDKLTISIMKRRLKIKLVRIDEKEMENLLSSDMAWILILYVFREKKYEASVLNMISLFKF